MFVMDGNMLWFGYTVAAWIKLGLDCHQTPLPVATPLSQNLNIIVQLCVWDCQVWEQALERLGGPRAGRLQRNAAAVDMQGKYL